MTGYTFKVEIVNEIGHKLQDIFGVAENFEQAAQAAVAVASEMFSGQKVRAQSVTMAGVFGFNTIHRIPELTDGPALAKEALPG